MAYLDLHRFAQPLVQGAQRLVHKEELWLEDESAGECHALLLSSGQLARKARRKSGELHEIEFFSTTCARRFLSYLRVSSG